MRTHFIDDFDDSETKTACGFRLEKRLGLRGIFVNIESEILEDADGCLNCLKFVKNRKWAREQSSGASELKEETTS